MCVCVCVCVYYCSGGELCMNMLFLCADTSIFVMAHPSVSLSLCLSVLCGVHLSC